MTGKSQRIAELNDAFRKANWSRGQVFKTAGIDALDPKDQAEIFNLVKTFNSFTEDNDPYGEHDFGAFDYKGERVMWKIDYYDMTLSKGSENPADEEKTKRVMTMMLGREW